MMVEHMGGLSYKEGILCWSTIYIIMCGDLNGNKVERKFKLLPNGATIGICAGKAISFECVHKQCHKTFGSIQTE